MKFIKTTGLILLMVAIGLFSISLFFGSYELAPGMVRMVLDDRGYATVGSELEMLESKSFSSALSFSDAVCEIYVRKNEQLKEKEEWDRVMWDEERDFAAKFVRPALSSIVTENQGWMLFLTFGLGVIGGLMYILPDVILLGPAGIKNDHVFHHPATNRGWVGWSVFIWLVSFYILLYFFPDLTMNWTMITDPVSMALKGKAGDRWFLYGFIYCTVMIVMAIRMYVKYRNNRYQIMRTSSVLFFQVSFAFLIPEVMYRFNLPGMDFKNIWPLDYDFFFEWNLDQMIAQGTLGLFMIVWGILLIIIAVPVFVYFFGKRWYCSWVCGCGGLAETLGDPYRHLSDKSVRSWKIERWLVHSVLVFALVMTGVTIYTFFSGKSEVLFVDTYDIQKSYGFLIGSVFAGVIGTGFYPTMGSRVWCRFGCPLAAYLGLVQRFKSRFRITTNGGQCISCGNCSTYCEMGIDVRWYAQRGQNIVRSSCVGCGICSAVCPRGVLKLENGPEEGRVNENPILIGREGIQLSKSVGSDI